MGEKTNGAGGQSNGPVIRAVGEQGEPGTSTSAGTADKRGTGAGTGSGTGTGTSAEEKKPTGLANVETDEQKREKRNARRRELYAQKQAEAGKKPKKVNEKKAVQPQVATSDQIGALLGTVSMIVASRPNMAHWQLTPKEIESISTPLSNMIAKSEALEAMAEHSDALALATACITIVVPRAVISISQMKEVKKHERTNGIKKPTTGKPGTGPNRENNSDDGNPGGNTPAPGSNASENQLFVGDPLY